MGLSTRSRRLTVTVLVLVAWLQPEPVGASSSDFTPTGRWAQKLVLTGVSNPPVVGEVTSRTTSLSIVDIAGDEGRYALETRVCDIAMTSDSSLVRTKISDSFVDAVAPAHRPAHLEETDDDSPRLVVPRHTTLLGVDLRHRTAENLPTSSDDPRVTDPDDDGKPGVSVRIEGVVSGTVYVVQRSWDAWTGRVVGDDRIRGTAQWMTEQRTLGASNIFLKTQTDTRPHPDDSKSWFEMVRVDDETSCSEIVRRSEKLFDR